MKTAKYGILLIMIVGLMAFSSDSFFKTSLKITVLNELGNPEEGVSVQLYPTEEDYRKETNPVTDIQTTDHKGRVKFNDLESTVYFINAQKGDKNNIGAGVQTDTLEENKLNKVTIIIE